MKKSSTPIQAERVFRLHKADAGWRIGSTATSYTYEGPVAWDAVPPWTADEWEMVTGLYAEIEESYIDDYGDRETRTTRHLNVPESELGAALETIGPERLALYEANDTLHHGFHAFRPGRCPDEYARYPVVGEVELFGRVVEYERGYRAQGVRIKKLRLVKPPNAPTNGDMFSIWRVAYFGMGTPDPAAVPDVLRDLGATYDCEVVDETGERNSDTLKQLTGEQLFFSNPYATVIPWQTSAENSKSTRSNWTKRMRHGLGSFLRSLGDSVSGK